MTPVDQYPSLSHIERELGDIHPVSLPWLDPLELVQITGDYGAVGDSASRTVAAIPSGLSRLRRLRRVASTIAGALLLAAFFFLIIFGLPGLFAGV